MPFIFITRPHMGSGYPFLAGTTIGNALRRKQQKYGL